MKRKNILCCVISIIFIFNIGLAKELKSYNKNNITKNNKVSALKTDNKQDDINSIIEKNDITNEKNIIDKKNITNGENTINKDNILNNTNIKDVDIKNKVDTIDKNNVIDKQNLVSENEINEATSILNKNDINDKNDIKNKINVNDKDNIITDTNNTINEEQSKNDLNTVAKDEALNNNNIEENLSEIFAFKDILEYTYNNNDTLNAERQKTKATETLKFKTLGENALPYVGIDLNGGYTDINQKFGTSPNQMKFDDDGVLEDNKIYLQQPLFKSGRTSIKLKAVEQQISMQKNKLNQTEQEVLFNTISSIINLLQSKKILEITIQNEESLRSSYEYIKARKSVGRATISDLSLAEARYSSARSDTIMAGTNYLNAKAMFLKITKLNPDNINVDYDEIFLNCFRYNILFDTVLDTVLQKNPQYQMAKNNYEMNKNNLTFAKTNFLPELFLNAQWGRQKTADITSQTAASVAINFKIPLFQSGVEYAQYRQAGHLVNEAKYTLNDVRDTLMQQTMSVYDEFLSSKSLIVSSKAYRDSAKVTLESTIAEERVGKTTIVDVLDRRREYFNTEISYLKNKTNLINQYYTLRLLMGELNMIDLFIY